MVNTCWHQSDLPWISEYRNHFSEVHVHSGASCNVLELKQTPSFLAGTTGAEVELSTGEWLQCKAVVGCDGVKSLIAAFLGLKPASYAGEVYYRCDPCSVLSSPACSTETLECIRCLNHQLMCAHPTHQFYKAKVFSINRSSGLTNVKLMCQLLANCGLCLSKRDIRLPYSDHHLHAGGWPRSPRASQRRQARCA